MERPDLAVSGESVYRAVHSGALDCELPGRRKASTLLRHHGKRRRGKGFWERRGKVRITHDISERPEEASSRRRIGDWEGDTVAGRQGALGAPDCFCRPYHPWERGTNENTNGLLRDWFPKGASLDAVTDDEVQRVYDSLNRRPRKRLGRKCPWEVYHRQSLHLP